MTLNGADVTDQIRLPEISLYASAVSAHPAVRAHLLEMQRKLARENNVVMDGRDIGTVVLPDATVKIFLTAAPEVRAMRRCRELEQRGTPQPYEQVLRDIVDRDWADSHRDIAPLCKAEDAVELDTGALTFDESLRLLLDTIRRRAGL
jgi:cytidylate kinase